MISKGINISPDGKEVLTRKPALISDFDAYNQSRSMNARARFTQRYHFPDL